MFIIFLLLNNIITSNQSGFTFGDSAINQLVNISNDFGKALDSGKEIRVVLCDISKAFDRVWHKGLLFKLKQYGISGNLLVWFERYLSETFWTVSTGGFKRVKFRVEDYKCGGSPGLYIRSSSIFIIHK